MDGSETNYLEGRGISVSFDGLMALADVDLELAPQQILGLIGPNGAGKTTLVNVLTGLQEPTSGRIAVGGEDLTGKPPHLISRNGVARTFQNVRLFLNLTVWENVAAGAVGVRMPLRKVNDVTEDILSWIGLADSSSLYASVLPYGAERRVGIARALAMAPRFLLLDEPAAGLNETECDEIIELISEIPARFGCGVLLIEHNMRVVMGVCQQLHVLDGGRTISEGDLRTVRNDPAVIQAYLGTSRATGHASAQH